MPSYDSVRDRLEHEPTRLLIEPTQSAGSVTARRYTHAGWQTGTLALVIDGGELDTTADATGQIALAQLAVDLAPIALPDSVFGKPAELADVRIVLARRPQLATAWTDADDATTSAMIDLDLDWSIAVDGSRVPLGTQHLPALPLEVVLSGAGDRVAATAALHAQGSLWSWADLFEITALELDLAASTSPVAVGSTR